MENYNYKVGDKVILQVDTSNYENNPLSEKYEGLEVEILKVSQSNDSNYPYEIDSIEGEISIWDGDIRSLADPSTDITFEL